MLFILITMVFLAYAFVNLLEEQLLFTFLAISGILIIQLILLFSYLKKSNRLLSRFVLAISNQDFTMKFSKDSPDTKEKNLKQAFNSLIDQYHSISMEKESQTFLIHHLLQVIPAGIMIADQEGKLLLKNRAMEDLLALEGVTSLMELKKMHADFYARFLDSGVAGTYIYEHHTGGGQKKLSVSLSSFLLLNKEHRLIQIQDISKEVDAGQIEAIQRLLRILTHEIMNSLAPINSLSETVTMLLSDREGQALAQEELSRKNYKDVLESVEAIKERAEGLDHFVNKFRTLTRLPESLETKTILVKDLFESVCRIMKSQLENVEVNVEVDPEEIIISADATLIEQVLINLVNNSLTAMAITGHPELNLKAFREDDHILVRILDNGTGIPQEKLSDIFMPFYSTKEKASGIGLSFVKQILRLHNASILVQSVEQKGSIFTIKFPNC